jgi:hypothetical protein
MSSLAVLAWLRMAAVSSQRAISLASAAFLVASVTLFIRSFMLPGRMVRRYGDSTSDGQGGKRIGTTIHSTTT